MITFHLTPYNTPPLNAKTKWDHIEDKRAKPLASSGTWHEVRVALIRAASDELIDADYQVDIVLLKDKDLRPYLEKTIGKWEIYTGHMEHHEWIDLLKELR